MSLFLSPAELVELTDRHTAPAQVKRLQAMRIHYFWQKGGRVKVARNVIESPAANASKYALEPDFSIFNKKNKIAVKAV
jgi:Domain of unknown function (DUF4224)